MTRLLVVVSVLLIPAVSFADDAAPQPPDDYKVVERKPSFEIYGFAQVDWIQDFKRMPSDWNATLRPTRIPTVAGDNGETIFSARQTRLGERSSLPVGEYDLKTCIEFDFFGRGTGQPDAAGQNTLRLRQAWGSWGPILGGLTASLFMDNDFWPEIIDYWGPDGMAFYRNVQIRYTPIIGKHTFAIALERPGSDLQDYTEVIPDLVADNELPDLTAQYRYTDGFGYIQLSGILRRLGYNSAATGSGGKLGWGLNGSSTINLLPGRLKVLLSVVGGQGIANYMNDATPDLAAAGTPGAPTAQAVPLLGLTGYLDFYWGKLLTSAIGYSTVIMWNTSMQPSSAFAQGQYASVNTLLTPFKGFVAGPEFLWGRRNDNGGAWGDDYRLQVSLRYSFSSLDFWHPS